MTNGNRKRFAGAFAKGLARSAARLAALALALGAAHAQQVDPLVPETSDPVELSAPVETISEASVSGGARAVLTKADAEAWLDGFMPFALERGGIAGAVVVIVKDGEILTSKGYGYADLETKKPVDPAATMFRPGSISKLFTWTAIMQLVEQGKVDLDADVNAYLDFEIPEAFGGPIKVRHLMTHTAGFEEAIKGIIIEDPEAMLPLDEYVKKALPARVYPAGEVPAYSNYATTLAGYIVARVSGQSFDDYIEQHIFAPIGMTRASFRQPLPADLEPLMS
ncbi:MAG: serine hydrolase domain-containing protein [Amphiplicatus sp.]